MAEYFSQDPQDIFLAERFADITLLRPRNVSNPRFEGFETPQNTQPCEACLCFNHGRQKLVPKPYHGGSEVFHDHEFKLSKPVQLQAQFDAFVEARARVLQRLKQEVDYNRLHQNRFPPKRASGFAKLSEGTGVFHPRVVTSADSDIAPTIATTAFANNKQVMGHGEIHTVKTNSAAAPPTSLSGNDVINYRLTPELSLPSDWTY